MASLLALSVLLTLPSSPQSLAWMPPIVPSATTKASRWRNNNHLPPGLFASNSPTAVTSNESIESLNGLTVPELKERLRSMGHKVTGKKSELIERLMIPQQNSSDDTSNKNIIDDIADNKPDNIDDIADNKSDLDPSLVQLPDPLVEALIRYASSSNAASGASSSLSTSPKLLPIQQKSYPIIAEGEDAVLFSPTGTGKTLAYILPLAARLFGWKRDGSLSHQKQAQKKRFMQQGRNKNDSLASQSSDVEAATPSILVIEPSRELALQVGKVWAKFHPTAVKTSRRHVVTVYGGVPMARHAAMLSSKTDVVIGTPGRIRELIREKYLSTSHIRSIVLDEADTLLNFQDNPQVEWLLDGMKDDYQLVLASATINTRVEKFVGEVMELEVGEEGYVVVDGDDADAFDDGGIDVDGLSTMDGAQVNGDDGELHTDSNGEQISAPKKPSNKKPVVRHWSIAASASSRTTLTSELIVTIAPRRGIVFVPSKAAVEVVAQELTERLSTANDVSIHVLHGDMVQAARSRTVNAFRGDTARMTRILVATDVASRGLDLPAVDLVLQYGVPRKTGKDGTYDSELYIHRTGRAGRFGSTRAADAILLYDRSQGEATTLPKLQEEMKDLHSIEMMPRKLPSPSEVMEASYDRAFWRCEEFGGREGTQSLVQYFADRLSKDLNSDDESFEVGTKEKESLLMHRLATAMAALSGLDTAVPPRSLLTSDPRDRTIQVWNESSSNPLSPPEVTKVVKALGSGKLGRISICNDGSAVFDLGAKKAELLLKNVASDADLKSSGWHFEMPSSLSTIPI